MPTGDFPRHVLPAPTSTGGDWSTQTIIDSNILPAPVAVTPELVREIFRYVGEHPEVLDDTTFKNSLINSLRYDYNFGEAVIGGIISHIENDPYTLTRIQGAAERYLSVHPEVRSRLEDTLLRWLVAAITRRDHNDMDRVNLASALHFTQLNPATEDNPNAQTIILPRTLPTGNVNARASYIFVQADLQDSVDFGAPGERIFAAMNPSNLPLHETVLWRTTKNAFFLQPPSDASPTAVQTLVPYVQTLHNPSWEDMIAMLSDEIVVSPWEAEGGWRIGSIPTNCQADYPWSVQHSGLIINYSSKRMAVLAAVTDSILSRGILSRGIPPPDDYRRPANVLRIPDEVLYALPNRESLERFIREFRAGIFVNDMEPICNHYASVYNHFAPPANNPSTQGIRGARGPDDRGIGSAAINAIGTVADKIVRNPDVNEGEEE